MHRFFLPPDCIHDKHVYFQREIARQIFLVLRLRVGQQVIVLDNLGNEFDVELTQLSAKEATGRVIAKRQISGEPDNRVSMYLCLSQREKFEWMLQKCTEIGVFEFIPVISERSLVRAVDETSKKLSRWTKIIQEAAEQSRRGRVPRLHQAMTLEKAVAHAVQNHDLALIAWEDEKKQQLRALLTQLRDNKPQQSILKVAVMIGPEGGFSDEEVELAGNTGLQSVSLGKRILRMETAAVVSAALVMYELEELG